MSEPVDIFGLAVHPADVFPMMSEAGLKELGADIETSGQLEPIIIGQGQMAMCAAVVGGAS